MAKSEYSVGDWLFNVARVLIIVITTLGGLILAHNRIADVQAEASGWRSTSFTVVSRSAHATTPGGNLTNTRISYEAPGGGGSVSFSTPLQWDSPTHLQAWLRGISEFRATAPPSAPNWLYTWFIYFVGIAGGLTLGILLGYGFTPLVYGMDNWQRRPSLREMKIQEYTD